MLVIDDYYYKGQCLTCIEDLVNNFCEELSEAMTDIPDNEIQNYPNPDILIKDVLNVSKQIKDIVSEIKSNYDLDEGEEKLLDDIVDKLEF